MNNLQTAAAYIKAQMNLPAVVSDWTYEQRVAYNKALATYIANNEQSFDQNLVVLATNIANNQNAPLDDTGFLSDLSTFGGALVDEGLSAGEAIGGIGNGILNAASLAKWLVPVVFVIAVGILLYGFYKKQTA